MNAIEILTPLLMGPCHPAFHKTIENMVLAETHEALLAFSFLQRCDFHIPPTERYIEFARTHIAGGKSFVNKQHDYRELEDHFKDAKYEQAKCVCRRIRNEVILEKNKEN